MSKPTIPEPCASCGIKGTRTPKGALCCRYITVKLMPPVDEDDWEEVRWWVAHEGVLVYADVLASRRTQWHLQVDTRCSFLGRSNLCKMYEARPDPCRAYSPHECEGAVPGGPAGPSEHDIELRTVEEVERYADAALRAAAVARAIRDPSEGSNPHRTVPYTIDP